MGDLSKNFSVSEFYCRCGNCEQKDFIIQGELIDKLQEIRDMIDKPIRITSGWRCFAHNVFVGGEYQSAHTTGEAADIACEDSRERFRLLGAIYQLRLFKRIGEADDFIHVDISTAEDKLQQRHWRYPAKPKPYEEYPNIL